MNPKVVFWTPIASLLLVIVFLIVSAIRKQKPPFINYAHLFLSGYGLTSSLYLGYVALFLPLSPVKDPQAVLIQTAVIIGAMAIAYLSVRTIYKIFTQDSS